MMTLLSKKIVSFNETGYRVDLTCSQKNIFLSTNIKKRVLIL